MKVLIHKNICLCVKIAQDFGIVHHPDAVDKLSFKWELLGDSVISYATIMALTLEADSLAAGYNRGHHFCRLAIVINSYPK